MTIKESSNKEKTPPNSVMRGGFDGALPHIHSQGLTLQRTSTAAVPRAATQQHTYQQPFLLYPQGLRVSEYKQHVSK